MTLLLILPAAGEGRLVPFSIMYFPTSRPIAGDPNLRSFAFICGLDPSSGSLEYQNITENQLGPLPAPAQAEA